MPRLVDTATKVMIVKMMTEENVPQREIERQTGVSRQFIRNLARKIGYQFPRNGIEISGQLCMCGNCGAFFRRPPSKVVRAKNQFCDRLCKETFFKGSLHPNWSHGKNSDTFSKWAKNQSNYQDFRNEALERAGHKCEITGRTDNLDVHHIFMKNEQFNPEKAFDVNNALVVCKDVHDEIHQLIRNKVGFEEAVEQLKKKYSKE